MLILTRKLGERIIHRQEIYERIREENLTSSGVAASDLSKATSLLRINRSKDK